ncbi:MAG: hypothetical protein IT285_11380 [Bdellovibrionales bacterium]|nr:hypothetical protein [Bdellovibrionales bacterium]
MSGGWEHYYIVFLAGAVGLFFPLSLAFASWLLSSPDVRRKYLAAISFRRRDRVIGGDGRRLNTRFFLGINIATLLLVLTLLVVPVAAAYRGLMEKGTGTERSMALALVVSVAGFLALSLFYAVRKGDLSWLRSHRSPGDGDMEGDEG